MNPVHPIRVLHCPEMIGGNPPSLARAERELGLSSWCVSVQDSVFRYAADEILCRDSEGRLRRNLKRLGLLARALRDFDLIHFNFGSTLMPVWNLPPRKEQGLSRRIANGVFWGCGRLLELRDLAWLRKAGKGIVVTFQGDDARQGDFLRANFPINPAGEVEPGYYSPETDRHKRRKIARFARYADRIFALNPDLLNVLPPSAEFLPYANIDLRDWKAEETSGPENPVPLVVHAPTERQVKGTRHILEAVSRLRSEGIKLEFILVEGCAREEARRIYRRADLFVDQLLCGWYGGVAVEAMALGKPVICYLRQRDLRYIPPGMRADLPVINANPETIHPVLKEWITRRRPELAGVGRRGRAYVEAWHDPLRIAARLKREYERVMESRRGGGRN